MADEQATGYKRQPILNIKKRSTVIGECKLVDKVFENAPMPVTGEFIKENSIDLVIHADDMSKESKNYWYSEPIKLGIYREVPYTKGISTSDIISRIRSITN